MAASDETIKDDDNDAQVNRQVVFWHNTLRQFMILMSRYQFSKNMPLATTQFQMLYSIADKRYDRKQRNVAKQGLYLKA